MSVRVPSTPNTCTRTHTPQTHNQERPLTNRNCGQTKERGKVQLESRKKSKCSSGVPLIALANHGYEEFSSDSLLGYFREEYMILTLKPLIRQP